MPDAQTYPKPTCAIGPWLLTQQSRPHDRSKESLSSARCIRQLLRKIREALKCISQTVPHDVPRCLVNKSIPWSNNWGKPCRLYPILERQQGTCEKPRKGGKVFILLNPGAPRHFDIKPFRTLYATEWQVRGASGLYRQSYW